MTDDQWLYDFVAQHASNLRVDLQESAEATASLHIRRLALEALGERVCRLLTDAVDVVNKGCGEPVIQQVTAVDTLTCLYRWRRGDYRFFLRITDYAVKVHWGSAKHQPDNTASYAIHIDEEQTAHLAAANGDVIPDHRMARLLLQPWLDGILQQ
jgi:hypothetical protein